MNEEKLDSLLDELKEKASPEPFAPEEEFKAEFFERARKENEAKPVRHTAFYLRLAGAAAILLVIGAILGIPAAQQPDLRRFFPELEMKLRDTLPLFGGDKGIGFAGDRLCAFERSSKKVPDRIWMLAVFDRNKKLLGSYAFALGNSEEAYLTGLAANGEFLTARTADGVEILQADLILQLADGSKLTLRDTMVGGAGELFYNSGTPYLLERTLVKLN